MKSSAEFECDCKAKTIVDYPVPELFKKTALKIKCSDCGSEWLALFRLSGGKIMCEHKLVRPTTKLDEALKRQKIEELRKLPEKKPFSIFVRK